MNSFYSGSWEKGFTQRFVKRNIKTGGFKRELIMQYYAKIVKSEDVFLISFPDLPDINTYGETFDDAIKNAAEALNACLETDFERGFSLIEAKTYKGKNIVAINVQPHIEIAYTLRKLRRGKSQLSVAQALGISYQAYQKLENPRKCNPTIKTLEKISNAFGKKLVVNFTHR
jgi:antitoxin HicB